MIVGKLFNLGEETNVHSLAQSESFKTIVGGGEVDIKKLYSQPFMYRNKAKMIFACNKLPYTKDTSDGFYRRLLLIPFKAKFVDGNDNKYLKEELLQELPGIFNIVLSAYNDLAARKDFKLGKELEGALSEYKNDNDVIKEWIEDRLVITGGKNDFTGRDELFNDFTQFCDARRLNKASYAYSYREFVKKIDVLAMDKNVEIMQRKKGTSRVRGYLGLKLDVDF
jgi:putative DNA primase/helicase